MKQDKLLQAVIANPFLLQKIKENSGLIPVTYICKECQEIHELPKFNARMGDTEEEDNYTCKNCDAFLLELETGNFYWQDAEKQDATFNFYDENERKW